jgi:hypothetical protein
MLESDNESSETDVAGASRDKDKFVSHRRGHEEKYMKRSWKVCLKHIENVMWAASGSLYAKSVEHYLEIQGNTEGLLTDPAFKS